MRKRLIVMIAALAIAGAAALPATASGAPPSQTYEVTITNLTDTQWFTPPLLTTHNRRADVFQQGHPASFGVKEIAENGNLAPLSEALGASPAVADVVVALGDPPPLAPGDSITVEVTGRSNARLLSMVSMLICTNDGFAGVDSAKLPRRIGQTSHVYGYAYDAGTEINTEDFNDIVPPCQDLNGVSDPEKDGTGESNPALAEGGVVTIHGGIDGTIADLTEPAHGFNPKAPAVAISATRTG